MVTKSLGDKYYKKKGWVKEVIDDFAALVVITETGAKVWSHSIRKHQHNLTVAGETGSRPPGDCGSRGGEGGGCSLGGAWGRDRNPEKYRHREVLGLTQIGHRAKCRGQDQAAL